jgi:hypothetical protein
VVYGIRERFGEGKASKKATGHHLRPKCLGLRRHGHESAPATPRGLPGEEGRGPDGALGVPAGLAGVAVGLGARDQERLVLALTPLRSGAQRALVRMERERGVGGAGSIGRTAQPGEACRSRGP